ncbi:phosphate ABC transporter permease subunit PstC [filamentous cyanobacterium LEGE 11480]|uniref:Phosphate transport system permease protein n=1 Tax=Romeriopsis navalis LEGE 11480 TaxID=2777977 RepID=A0A928VMH3_9CYAN|nr:phosphate ABC transporter permease subunit PstC [Romeriopsis navalis LEGE 11480]
MCRYSLEVGFIYGLRLLTAIAAVVVLFIVGFLIVEAWPVLRQIAVSRFLRDQSWHPVSGQYNLLPMIIGTSSVTFGAMLLAVPFGLASGIFCQYYAPDWLARIYRRLIELLAGIPSVVYGFWGLVVLVPLIGQVHPPGPSLLAGILILALMIMPTIALITDSSLATVPARYLWGAQALGLSRWGIVRGVALPAARSGILAGIVLALGRAIGETMAVLMVCGNVVQVPDSLFAPVRTLTANMALEMAYATDLHRSALFVSGLVLMGCIGVLVFVADQVGRYG